MSTSPRRRARRRCARRGHERVKKIDGRLACTSCGQWLEPELALPDTEEEQR